MIKLRLPPMLGRLRVNFSFKIFLTFMMVLIFFSGFSSLVFIEMQKSSLKNYVEDQGKLLAGLLATNVELGLFFDDETQIGQQTEAFMSIPDIAACIIYDTGGGIVHHKIRKLPKIFPTEQEFINGVQAGPVMAVGTANDFEERDDFFVFIKPVLLPVANESVESLYFETEAPEDVKTTVIGHVQIIMAKEPFEQAVREIAHKNLILVVAFLFLSVFASFLLTRDIVKPLQNLIAKVRAAGGGKGESSLDEISLLDDTFKALIEDLERSFATIEEFREHLEDKVVERTAELEKAMVDLKETQAQLVHSEKMVAIGQLVAGVAHEINNTTNFVSGALPPLHRRLRELKTLLDEQANGLTADGKYGEIMQSLELLLANIGEGARRTVKIVEDLKNFSRPDDEKFKPVDINGCLESTLGLAYPEYKFRFEIKKELAENLPLVNGSQGQLNQVFMNILLNSIHAQPDGGAIDIRTWAVQGLIHIVIRDHGPGMSDDVKRRIFEPFFTTKEVGRGSGLGLSISYGIIQKHLGEIKVSSTPGEGSEFEIILPAMEG